MKHTEWMALKEDFSRISQLMKRGIVLEEKTGKEYFTGYEYNTLYDWDQYFEAVIQLYLGWETKYMRNGVTIFLDYQQQDGFIARTVPVRSFEMEGSEHVKPFLSQISLLIYKREGELDWLAGEYYSKLKKYLLYWLNDKDVNKNHLAVWDSAPHTGMDNQHERAGWWKDCISEGIDLNSYIYRECNAFALLANILGEIKDEMLFKDYAGKVKKAIQSLLWDEETGFFYDRNAKTGELIKLKSVAGFATMWAGIPTFEQASRMVSEHLINPDEFWKPFPLPTYAADENGYSEEYLPDDLGCNWRANTWIPTNYYVFQGLRRYGYTQIAAELAHKTYKMVKKIGDREYYTSESCKGCGLDPFWGWSLLAYFMPVEAELGNDPTTLEFSFSDAFTLTAAQGRTV